MEIWLFVFGSNALKNEKAKSKCSAIELLLFAVTIYKAKSIIMKKIFVLILCFFSFQVYSQTIVLLGLGPSMICGNESWKDPVGVQIAIESRFLEISENSSLSTGIGFSYQGAGWEDSYDGHEYSGKVRLTYFNVPVLFNYVGASGFYGEIGLQPGVLLSAKDKYDGHSEDYGDYVKGFELGLPIGGGYQVNDQLEVGVRATIGLTNLDDTGSDVADRNFMIVAMARYQIDWNPFNK